MTRRVLALIAAGALTLGALPARAYVPEKTPDRHLEASIRRTIALPAARTSFAGLVVMRGGRELFAVHPDHALRPASLMKLATTTTAMIRLGPDFRFATRVLGARSRTGVAKTLWLVGGGDPTLATRAYRHDNFLPKPDDPVPVPVFRSSSPTIEQLAAAVARAGVRRISGDLVIDDTLFDAVRTQPGWIPDYLRNNPDTGYIDALTVNEGRADLKGKTLLTDPAETAGALLKTALVGRGVMVTGAVHHGSAPAGAPELARISSPPLREIISYTNRYSINYDAEILLKGLGARFGGAGTTVAGVTVVRTTLASIGVPLQGFVMRDGSGLSVLDRATPRTLAAILGWMLQAPGAGGAALRDSIPVAGGPGTLFKRMTKPPTKGNLRGKTGSIRHVRGMAGWVTPPDGIPLVYVSMFNDVPRPLQLTSALDLIGLALALFGPA